MEAIIVLIMLIMAVIALDVLAVRFGVDSRDVIEDTYATRTRHEAI